MHSSNILGIALKRYYVPKILVFCNAAWQDCWNHCTMYHQLHCLDIWPTSDNSVCHQTSMFVLCLMLAVCVWIRPDSERWSLHVKHNPSLEGLRRRGLTSKTQSAGQGYEGLTHETLPIFVCSNIT